MVCIEVVMSCNTMVRTGIRYAVPIPNIVSRGEIIQWCEKTFGPPSMLQGRWFALEYTIQFESVADRNWFILRWS